MATVAADLQRETALAQALGDRADVELVMRCVDRVEAIAVIRGGGIDALIALGSPQWFDEELADEALRAALRIVGVGVTAEGSSIARHATNLLPGDASPSDILRRCRESAISSPPPPISARSSPANGRLISVWGPKGAPGRTTVAMELASVLAAIDRSTLLIDADPYGGDVRQAADIVEDLPSVIWAAQLASRGQLDAGRIVSSLRRIGERGPVLMPGLPRADLWHEVSPYGWRQLLIVSRSLFRYAVCDVGFCLEVDDHPYAADQGERNLMTRSTLQSSDKIVAVCRGDAVGIKNFMWAYDALTDLVEPEKVVIVANRVRQGEEREVADVLKRQTGVRPVAYLPPIQDERRLQRRSTPRRRSFAAGLRSVAVSLGVQVKAQGVLTSLSGRG